MRKLLLQMQMSVDGYMADTNGNTDRMVWNWGEESVESFPSSFNLLSVRNCRCKIHEQTIKLLASKTCR